jgi:hypothetical protein
MINKLRYHGGSFMRKILSVYGLGLALGLAINGVVALWTERNLEFWVSYFKGSPVDVPYIVSFIITPVVNIWANALSEVARLFV